MKVNTRAGWSLTPYPALGGLGIETGVAFIPQTRPSVILTQSCFRHESDGRGTLSWCLEQILVLEARC